MARDKYELLEELRRNKRNRKPSEVNAVLEAFGWMKREASREGSVWSKARLTLTLPTPHGKGDKSLKTFYVSLVVRMIDQAEARSGERAEAENDEDD